MIQFDRNSLRRRVTSSLSKSAMKLAETQCDVGVARGIPGLSQCFLPKRTDYVGHGTHIRHLGARRQPACQAFAGPRLDCAWRVPGCRTQRVCESDPAWNTQERHGAFGKPDRLPD